MDTNAIHDYLQELYPIKGLLKVDKILENEANLSVITKIEILSYQPENEYFAQQIQRFIDTSNIYSLNEEIIEKTIQLRRAYRLKIGDAIIAATAQLYDFTIITNNERDFNKIKGLRMLNPFKI